MIRFSLILLLSATSLKLIGQSNWTDYSDDWVISEGNHTESFPVALNAGIHVAVSCDAGAGNDQDDMCIWLHPDHPDQSTVITSDKDHSKLFVFNLEGEILFSYPLDYKPGNIDLIYNFPLNGEVVDLVGFNARDPSPPQFVFYRVDHETRELVYLGGVLTTEPWSAELYGFCLYRSPGNHEYYAFGCDYRSRIQQYRLFDDGTGTISMEHKRTWQNGSAVETEGMVADLETGLLYAGNEQQGIYVYRADEGETTDPVRFIPVAEDTLAADVEGLTIYYAAEGQGYLLASSQGRDYFSVFERQGGNAFVRKFNISGVGDTDGIDVLNASLNSTFSSGLFSCHNGDDSPITVNLVKWEDIALIDSSELLIDTGYWNPREALFTRVERSTEDYSFCSIYPNPAEKWVRILLEADGLYTIEISSVNGRRILRREVEGTTHELDLSSLREGVYLITVRSGNFVTSSELIKL